MDEETDLECERELSADIAVTPHTWVVVSEDLHDVECQNESCSDQCSDVVDYIEAKICAILFTLSRVTNNCLMVASNHSGTVV